MKYSTLKELRKAGFPHMKWIYKDEDENYVALHPEEAENRKTWIVPGLEPLIDNIKEFHHLSRWLTKEGYIWNAFDKKGRCGRDGDKKTAVAKLFILQHQ